MLPPRCYIEQFAIEPCSGVMIYESRRGEWIDGPIIILAFEEVCAHHHQNSLTSTEATKNRSIPDLETC